MIDVSPLRPVVVDVTGLSDTQITLKMYDACDTAANVRVGPLLATNPDLRSPDISYEVRVAFKRQWLEIALGQALSRIRDLEERARTVPSDEAPEHCFVALNCSGPRHCSCGCSQCCPDEEGA